MRDEIVERRRHRGFDLRLRLADSFELADFGARSLQRLERGVDRAAVFALEPGQFLQAVVDFLEPRGIRLDFRRVGAERARRLFEIGARRLDHLERVAKFRIERGGFEQARLGARDGVGRGAVGAVERLLGFERGGGELAGVGEHGSLARQRFIFAGDEAGALEFGRAEPREFQQVRAFAFAAAQFMKASADFFARGVAFAIRREFVVESCVAIENLAMALARSSECCSCCP